MMTDFGITHSFETYQGEHGNEIPERIESRVLLFFSNKSCHELSRVAGVVGLARTPSLDRKVKDGTLSKLTNRKQGFFATSAC